MLIAQENMKKVEQSVVKSGVKIFYFFGAKKDLKSAKKIVVTDL